MPRIIAFTSPKGGCGATFVCASLWQTLSEKSKRVLALDMCFDKCSLDYALDFHNDYVYTLADVMNGEISLNEAVCGNDGTFLRADYENCDFDFPKAGEILRDSDYEYILVDISLATYAIADGVLSFADELVVVTDCTEISVKFCEQFIQTCGFPNAKIIINKVFPQYIKEGIHLTADEVLDFVGCGLLGLIPWDLGTEAVLRKGVTHLCEYEGLYKCFDNVSKRLLGDRIPACDFGDLFKDDKVYKYLTKGRK